MASNMQQTAKLEKLQFQLEAFIESLRTVGVIAGDFQQMDRPILMRSCTNGLVENMRHLSRLKEEYVDIQVPLAAIEYIDEGHNPELFTCHQLEQSLADYNTVQRKVQAYKNFRSQLIQQLEPVFPAEIKTYSALSQAQWKMK